MAGYEGGFTGAVNSGAQREQQAASAQHLMAMVRAAALAEQAQQRQRAAGGMAFNALSGAMGGAIPPPPPGVPGGGPQAPMPGTNSQAQMAPPPMQAAPMPQPPVPGGAAPMPQGAAPGGAVPMPGPLSAGRAMPPPIPPFRPLPSAPPAAASGPDGIPPPPAAAPPPMVAPAPERQVVNLPSIIQALNKGQGTPEEKMEALNALRPVLNEQQTQELKLFQAQTNALKAANEAYRKEMDLMLREDAEARKLRHGDARVATGQQNADTRRMEAERRLRRVVEGATGGAGNLKSQEFIYPKKEDGTIDQSAEPIGVRGVTKTGKIVVLDADGVPTTQGALGGSGTAKEARAIKPPGGAFKLPAQAMKDIVAREKIVFMLDDLIKRQESAIKKGRGFGGYVFDKAGDVVIKAGRSLGTDNPDEINFFADLETVAQPDRHSLFGATLTGNELKSWREGWVGKGDDPQVMLGVLKSKRAAYDRMLKATRGGYERFAKGGAQDSSPQVPGDEPLDYAPPGSAPRGGAPAVGTVRKGYRFKGGDPASPSSWEKAA